MIEDLYRSYRLLNQDGEDGAAAALFAHRYLLPVLGADRDALILEIGAGTGSTLRAMKRAGFTNARGVDTSESQIDEAKKLGTEIDQGDGLEVLAGYPSASIDALLLLDVLEHFSVEEVLRLLDLAKERLKPGGLIVARVPNGEALFGGSILYGDITHRTAFTHRSLRQAFSLRGLETVSVTAIRPMVHSALSAMRAVTWAMVELSLRVASASESGRFDALLTRNILAVARRRP